MEIAHEQAGAVSVLAPVGRLDTDSATDLELALQDLIAVDARHFVLDFAKIGYVSSAGLRVLLMAAKQLDGGKGSLRLCGLSPQVRQVFDIARRAASLLGAKAAPKPTPAAKAAAPKSGGGDRTMALQSLKTPLAPAAGGAPTPAGEGKPKGFLARLLGMFRR